MSSDEKALEEFHKKHCHKGLSDDKWYINIYELEKIEQFILKTRQKAREEEHQLLDTHTVKEELTTTEKTCPNKGKENCICSQCYMPTKPEKKCCKNCGLDYQDPIYCSIFGRSADKHEWM